VKLRGYQDRAVVETSERYAAGFRSPALVMPTGSGKTPTAAEMIRRSVFKGRRVGFLANRDELLNQAINKLTDAGIADIRIIKAGNDNQAAGPVFAASIPTLTSKGWSGELPPADFLVFDECHHAPAATWAGLVARYPNAKLLGLTATPQRGDGRSLHGQFDSIVVGCTVKELTELGHLVPCKLYAPPRILSSRELAQDPVDAYVERVNGQKAIVFCSTVERAKQTALNFQARSIRAEWVSGECPDRENKIARFSKRAFDVLVNVSLVIEGFDDPESSAGLLARRFTHVGSYLQALGRFLRPFPGKTHATVVDLCGSALVHGTPDLEREYSLDGKGIKDARESLRQCQQCGGVFVQQPSCPYCAFQTPPLTRAEAKALGLTLHQVTASHKPTSWPMRAKRRGVCAQCHQPVEQGAWIVYSARSKQAMHTKCAGQIQRAA
jgi:DNA repair protein RadD